MLSEGHGLPLAAPVVVAAAANHTGIKLLAEALDAVLIERPTSE